MQNHSKGILYAIITAICWGFLAIALKVTSYNVDSYTIVWFRFLIAFVSLACWQAYHDPSEFRIFIKPPVILIVAAIALSVNYFTFMLGIHFTSPSNAQVFIQIGPILLATAGFVVFKEKIRIRQLLGFALAICGFLIFFNQQLASLGAGGGRFRHGITLVIISGSAWATYAILQKILVTRFSSSTLNLFLFGLPILIFLPFVKIQSLFALDWIWWLLLLFVGLNTLISYTFIAKALKLTEANKVSIIIILNPVITFVTMAILTIMEVSWIEHEDFTIITVFGAILVLTGSFMVAWKRKTRIRKKKHPRNPSNHL